MDSILFVGVTGTFGFGQSVVDEICSQVTSFKRIAVYHDTSREVTRHKEALLARWNQAGIETVAANGYKSPEPFRGFDSVLIFLGNHGLHLQPQIIDLAIQAGVRHFYPSEYGADILVGENRHQRYYKYKVATREHLERRTQDVPDLGWTLFLLGRLTEWAVLSHFGVDNASATAKIYGSAKGRQSLLATSDAAAYIVATLKRPLDHTQAAEFRRTFRISGSSPTYEEMFSALKTATGRTYDVTYLDVEEAIVEEGEARARTDVQAELAANHKLIQGRQGTLLPEPWDNDLFPNVRTPRTVVAALKEAFESPMYRERHGLLG